MNELSTEEMQYMMNKTKALFEASGIEGVLIMGAGPQVCHRAIHHIDHHVSHQDIVQLNLAQRIEKAAEKLSTKFLIVTADEIKSCAENNNYSIEILIDLIDGLSMPRPEYDFRNLKFTAPALDVLDESFNYDLHDRDDRPFYLKAADKGGRKRKQRYYNKQRW